MKHKISKININVFRDGTTWFGARWIDDEYDGCDSLEISDESTAEEAMEAARTMELTVSGERHVKVVDDVDTANNRVPAYV